MRFSSVTIFSTLTWWYFNWRWHHSLPWEGWHHLSYQIRKHQGRFKTIVPFWHQLIQYPFPVSSVLKLLGSFISQSSAGHLLLHPEAACPPIILLATSEWYLFNHPIFSLVIPLTTSLLVSFPHSAPPGSVRPSILVLFKILRMVLPLYSTYFPYTTPYPCPQYYLTRSIV